jgi:hypothetical protein
MITGGAKVAGVDPTTKRGRQWWVDGCGGNESDIFIDGFAPIFTPSGDSAEYFEDLQLCLVKETPKALMGSKKKKIRTKRGKKGKSKKGKKGKKGKTNRKTKRRRQIRGGGCGLT